jgi:predicted RNase H-like nuclease
MSAAGVDRTRGGWVVVTLEDGCFDSCTVIATAREIPESDVVAIDIPMWHPPAGQRRRSELEARRILGARASTVFLTPPAEALSVDWGHARRNGVSKQMWNLAQSITEVTTHRRPGWIEAHPEVVFASLAGHPLPSKKTWQGHHERRAHLANVGVHIPDDLGPAGRVPPDDILDAAACALVASRHPQATIALGEGEDLIWSVDS